MNIGEQEQERRLLVLPEGLTARRSFLVRFGRAIMLDIAELWRLECKGASAADIIRAVEPLFAAQAKQRERTRQRTRAWRDRHRDGHGDGHAENASQINGHVTVTNSGSSLSLERKKERLERKKERKEPANVTVTVTVTKWPFDEFWKLFPNKVGKQAALKAFAKVERSHQVSFDDLMAGLRRYARKTDDRPWCNPATWLNQGRWEDQPATVEKSLAAQGYNMTGCV